MTIFLETTYFYQDQQIMVKFIYAGRSIIEVSILCNSLSTSGYFGRLTHNLSKLQCLIIIDKYLIQKPAYTNLLGKILKKKTQNGVQNGQLVYSSKEGFCFHHR